MAISKEKSKQITKTRRKQILEAALKEFYKNGYTNTRVEDIAKSANVSKGLIFRYFSTKLGVFKALNQNIDHYLDTILDFESPSAAIKNLTNVLCDIKIVEPAKLYMIVFLRGELPVDMEENIILNKKIKNRIVPIVKRGQECEELRKGDPEELSSVYLHYVLGVFCKLMNEQSIRHNLPNLDYAFDLILKNPEL